jgi:hypothetical protein
MKCEEGENDWKETLETFQWVPEMCRNGIDTRGVGGSGLGGVPSKPSNADPTCGFIGGFGERPEPTPVAPDAR